VVIAVPQIAEAMNGETVLVFNALLRKPLDMPRQITPRPQVQLMPGYAAVNTDRARDRFCDVFD
jgi:hypothetical protein